MAKRIAVVISQGQSANPVKRRLEEDLVGALLAEPGVDVMVVPHLYDLTSDGTGILALQGVAGPMVVISWLFPRAAFWTLDRHGIRGHWGATLIGSDEEEEDEEEDEAAGESNREAGGEVGASGAEADDQTSDTGDAEESSAPNSVRQVPNRRIYCLDFKARQEVGPFVEEIRRIRQEEQTTVVELASWIGAAKRGEPAAGNGWQLGQPGRSDNGHQRRDPLDRQLGPVPTAAPAGPGAKAVTGAELVRIQDDAQRRWYPVIDYSRCTNCMECIDFCLFGVYGVDGQETILVEQPDNCRKGCPACSRVCPENAIIFPQHKTPAIAGSSDAVASLKIDLSKLFGAPDSSEDPLVVAARERDEQLVLAGRQAVGMSVGIPKRQAGERGPKDELDELIDRLDELEL